MAANQEIPEAQFVLGEFYKSGKYLPLDISKAKYWYNKAKENGYEQAEARLKQIDLITDKEFSSVDIKNLELSAKVLKAAESGLDYYAGRKGMKQDFYKAFKLLLSAAKKGHITAQYGIAGMYFHGEGTKCDLEKALLWYTKSAEAGLGASQNEVAKMHYNGVGCDKDIEKATYWLGKAADNGIVEATFLYGVMLIKGQGVIKDKNRGFEYIKKAARNGHEQAQKELKQLGIEFRKF